MGIRHILIRADASTAVGTGHIMRCLVLADLLKKNNDEVVFICRESDGNMISFIQSMHYRVYTLPQAIEHEATYMESLFVLLGRKIDWLIVDHYGIDAEWEKRYQNRVGHILVIDDLADRPHLCDILVDQTLSLSCDERYAGLIPRHCALLTGPRYCLLRNEFIEQKSKFLKRTGIVRHILVFFGGSNPTNETLKALSALKILGLTDISIDVIVGAVNPYKDEVKNCCQSMSGANFYCQVNNMAEFMARADLAIGAGGVSTWERCFLGLPSIIISVAQNQLESALAVHEYGAALYLGKSQDVSSEELALAIKSVYCNRKELLSMEEKALEIMGDGEQSGAGLILQKMEDVDA